MDAIEREIMQKHNQADAFISLFFAGVDAVFYLIIITLFGCEYNLNSPSQKLSVLVIIDAILRLIHMYTDEYSKHWYKETLLCSFSTTQFYMILTCLNQIFIDCSSNNSLENDLEIKNPNIITSIFFFLTFSFKGLLDSYKKLSAVQYLVIIGSIYYFYTYIGSRINTFLINMIKKHTSVIGENFLINAPFFICIYLILNYIFELISLLVDHKLYASYMIMLCRVFQEVGKYLVFLLLIIINHSFIEYMKDYDYGYDHNTNNNEIKSKDNERTKVNIYKDEDEFDDV